MSKLLSELAKGAWSALTAYTIGDIVDNDGSSYICISNNTNQEPPNATYWALLASKGDTGSTGATGATGERGPQGEAGVSFNWLGTWSSETAYDENDVVEHNGSTYIANTSNTNKTPGSDPEWDLMAQKGADGEGAGDVTGPASSTNNNIVLFNGTTGKAIKDGGKGIPTGDIVGTSDSQTLTNKTINANNNTISNLEHGSEVDNPSSGVHGVAGDIVGTTDAQELTNKTISGANNTITNINRAVGFYVVEATTDLEVGDGVAYLPPIPSFLNGMVLSAVMAQVITAGETGTTDIQIHNLTDAQDMLSTLLTIDSEETKSSDAETPAVIDPDHDDVATGDVLRIDIDAVSTTAPKGLVITLEFSN